MQESEEQIEDMLVRRLITNAGVFDDEENVKKQTSPKELALVEEGRASAEIKDPEVEFVDDKKTTEDLVPAIVPEFLPSTGDFAKVEKSLTGLGFFTPSSRRLKDQKVKKMTFNREVDGRRVEGTASIVPSAMFGLPITADQDKYLALQKLITMKLQADGKIENPIRFKSAELLHLLGRTDSGNNYKEISDWLDVMAGTLIVSDGVVWHAGQSRMVRDRLHVFDRATSFGKEMEDGSIADANYVWLSSWQLANINHNFLLPIDIETYRKLKNHIAKALVPLLQIWLYATVNRR